MPDGLNKLVGILHKKRTEVWLIVDSLSEEEFGSLLLTIQLDMPPESRNFYDKARNLFTLENGGKMDGITKNIVLSLAKKQGLC